MANCVKSSNILHSNIFQIEFVNLIFFPPTLTDAEHLQRLSVGGWDEQTLVCFPRVKPLKHQGRLVLQTRGKNLAWLLQNVTFFITFLIPRLFGQTMGHQDQLL